MDKKQVMAILDNPLKYSTEDRKEAAQLAIKILDDTAEKEELGRPYYHFIMYGNEGLEGYLVVRDVEGIWNKTLRNMELRARMNSQRDISGYAFKTDVKVGPEMITPDVLAQAKKLF